MALNSGTRLGPYEILSPLGAGGMGEVYRAKHRTLGRQVAIKVLPHELAADPSLRERFEREARAASALTHPNTVTIHDIDEQDGVHYIAMELVEGKTLRDRLGEGPLAADELLRIATQVAQGLAEAHAAGVVHRDLKPSNVMMTPAGLVKILDFGLAKRTGPSADAASELTTAPEITRTGVVLGTVPYMSPEQAAGRAVDHRSDQFSFGSILYEMTTGRRAFEKDSAPQTLAAIIEAEPPPVVTLNDRAPAALVGIIERCLSKEPRDRYDSTGDLAKELARQSGSASTPSSKRWIAVTALVVAVGIVGAALFWKAARREAPDEAEAPLVAVPLTSYPGEEMEPTFSPDGSQLAFSWNGGQGENFDIYVRVVGPGEPHRLTETPEVDLSPAWSPDGRTIAFLRRRSALHSSVMLIPALGGAERELREAAAPGLLTRALRTGSPSLSWTPDSSAIVVSHRSTGEEGFGLFAFPVDGGPGQRLTSPPPSSMGDLGPAVSPDGRQLAFVRTGAADLYVLALSETLEPVGSPTRLTSASGLAAWTPDGREIVFSAEGVLHRIEADGSNRRRLPGLGDRARWPALSSRGERLVFTHALHDQNIWAVERSADGRFEPARAVFSSTREEAYPQFSPDGTRVAFDSNRSGSTEIWVCDVDGSNCSQLTSFGAQQPGGFPTWSPDGQRIAFDMRVDGPPDIYVIDAEGGGLRRLTEGPESEVVPTWSRDGKWVYFASLQGQDWGLWKTPSSGEGPPVQVTGGDGIYAQESPDGQFVYYAKSFAEPSVWRRPLGGGEESQVLPALLHYGTFAVAERGIYFVPPKDSEGNSSIEFFEFETGTTTRIAAVENIGRRGFAVSPDERTILFTRVDLVGSDLMLVENFR